MSSIRLWLMVFFIGLFCVPNLLWADEVTVPSQAEKELNDTLASLDAITQIKLSLTKKLNILRGQLKVAVTDSEKDYLRDEIASVEEKLHSIDTDFETIATDIDLSVIKSLPEKKFNLQNEIVSLLKPIVEELNHATKDVRKKSKLREKIALYKEKLEYANKALESINNLLEHAGKRKQLKKILKSKKANWQQQASFFESQYQSASLQLKKLEEAEVPFTVSTRNYLKQFFQERGFYLFQAFMLIVFILLLAQFSRALMKRFIPAFSRKQRSFRMRLLDLFHRLTTIILLIVGPMLVFYLAEDWVLFSLSILLLIGVLWTLRMTIPQYWSQIQLFLNIGSVREGERIFLEGLPWRVAVINVFCTLENPVANIRQRVPIRDLVSLKSRPCCGDEPWFPCAKGDWVILSDGIRGKVVGISHELVKLVQRGGAHKTYLTTEFWALSPLNLSVDFRIKETIGIAYHHQAESTNIILDKLKEHIMRRIQEEGYANDLLNLRVEFEFANTSSLDLVVIADFKGRMGDLYNRLRRAIQRWCVDACTENNWEIPFTQITLHSVNDG